jgi:hypothetical protein
MQRLYGPCCVGGIKPNTLVLPSHLGSARFMCVGRGGLPGRCWPVLLVPSPAWEGADRAVR